VVSPSGVPTLTGPAGTVFVNGYRERRDAMRLGQAALGTRLMRGLAAGALWMGLLWGWLTGYKLLGRRVSNVVRASAFNLLSGEPLMEKAGRLRA